MARQNETETFWRVSFEAPPIEGNPKTDFYFGSLKAIYDMFTPQQIGCRVEHLWNLKIGDSGEFENRLCKITREQLNRKMRNKPV